MEVTMDIGQDFGLQSMLSSGHDDFNFHINISDSETFSNEISVSPTPLHADTYIDEFTGTLTRRKSLLDTKSTTIWKELPNESPYHPKRPNSANNVVIVVDNNAESDEPEIDPEPFDYSIFLNKPASPNKEDDSASEIPIQEPEEVVLDHQIISEEKVEELLKENQVCFGNVVPKKIEKHDDGFFHCDLCSLKFNRKGNYKRHRLTHFVKSKKTPYRYQCEECNRNFLQRCDLQRHMHIHKGTYPYKCDVCDNGYLRRKDLEVHMNFHRGEKNYKCNQCEKSFFSRGDLSRHTRSSHDAEEKLKCGHCSHRFSRESTLLQHMQRKHNEMILSAFKEQVCKLHEMPSVVEVDSVPFKVSTMTSPVTMGHVVTPSALLHSVLAAKALQVTPSKASDLASLTVTSSSPSASSNQTVAAVLTASITSLSNGSVTSAPVTLLTSETGKLTSVPVIPFINLAMLPALVSTAPYVTSSNNMLTSPVCVDVLTSQEAKTETVTS